MGRVILLARAMCLIVFVIDPPVTLADPPAANARKIELDHSLIGHWPLAGDLQDHSGNGHHAVARGAVDPAVVGPSGAPKSAVALNGRDSCLEVARAPQLDNDDFSFAAWVYTDETLDDVPGDIVSQYDPARRRGFHLTIKNNAGVANTQANFRQLQFGIDNDRATDWTDCGRPGSAVLAFALVQYDGHLYAGTCEPGKNESGHIYRYAGGTQWIDCGSPAPANAVTAMAVHQGKLYAGVGKYRLAGSALPESENPHIGGRVFRYEGGSRWIDCGQLPGVDAVGGMVVFRGKLYASSLYRPAAFVRYEGESNWTDCGTPGKRVEALGVYNGYIYATSYDGGLVFRYDGSTWTDCGQLGTPEENTQTYSFAVYQGRLHVGTWRTGRVYRFEDVNQWTDVGRLGEELEVMGMLVHNGRLVAGTLPLAEVYAFEGDAHWRRLARLDHTPDVRYRRAWTMAEFQGRLFCSTLPSGRIYWFAAGKSATWDREFPSGWHHVAAVKDGGRLQLYVDGRVVGQSDPFDPGEYDLGSTAPLVIGFGQNDHFLGRLSDVRCYDRGLSPAEVERLAGKP